MPPRRMHRTDMLTPSPPGLKGMTSQGILKSRLSGALIQLNRLLPSKRPHKLITRMYSCNKQNHRGTFNRAPM